MRRPLDQPALLACSLVACLCACSATTDIFIGSDNPLANPGSGSAAGSAAGDADPPVGREPVGSVADAAVSPQLPDDPPPPPPVDAGSMAERDSGADAGMLDAGGPPAPCVADTADCDGDPANGCEVDTSSDMQHCGGCDRRCHNDGHDAIAAQCMAGRCEISCRQDLVGDQDCDGDPDNGCEASLLTDDRNCGSCGVVCNCFNGVCL